MGQKIILYSPFKPIPIAHQLKDEMNRAWTADERKVGRVMGRGTEKGMRLQIKSGGKNPRPSMVFDGETLEKADGTQISGRFHMPSGAYWVTGVALVLFLANAGSIYNGSMTDLWSLSQIPAAAPSILIMGIVIWYVAKTLGTAKSDKTMILGFLAQTVEARSEKEN